MQTKENGRAGGNSSLLTGPDGNTYKSSAKPLNHRQIAAKPADLQGIIWNRGRPGTQRAMEALSKHKTEQAVDTQPRICHLYYTDLQGPSPHKPGQ